MSHYKATVLNLKNYSTDYYSTVARSLIHCLGISDITWIDNTISMRTSCFFEHSLNDTIHDIIHQSYAQAIIIHYTKLYRGKPDRRFIGIEFTDYPLLVDSIYQAPECVRLMAMQRHDSKFPSIKYPRLDAGFFSSNLYYSESQPTTAWKCIPAPPYIGNIDQLFFGGTVQPSSLQRKVIPLLEKHPDVCCLLTSLIFSKEINGDHMTRIRPYNYMDYLDVAAKYRVHLALEGTSGFCVREFDALRMGAPLIMSPWKFSHRMEPLVDGEHYFAAEYDSNIEIFAERILRRFNEIRHDQKKRDQIRLNGQQWFEQNCTIPHITAKIVEWIETAFANTSPLT